MSRFCAFMFALVWLFMPGGAVPARAETVGRTAGWLANYCGGKLSITTDSHGYQATTWDSHEGAYCAAFFTAAAKAFALIYAPDGGVMLGRDIITLDQPAEVYAIFSAYLRRHTEMSKAEPVFVIIKALRDEIQITCDSPCKPVLEDLPAWYRVTPSGHESQH